MTKNPEWCVLVCVSCTRTWVYEYNVWACRSVLGFCTSLMNRKCPLKSVIAGHMMYLVVVGVHFFVEVLVVLVLVSAVSADASHDGLLDLWPLASDVAWLVVVASASSWVDWVWSHFECFAIFLVGPVGATKLVLNFFLQKQFFQD